MHFACLHNLQYLFAFKTTEVVKHTHPAWSYFSNVKNSMRKDVQQRKLSYKFSCLLNQVPLYLCGFPFIKQPGIVESSTEILPPKNGPVSTITSLESARQFVAFAETGKSNDRKNVVVCMRKVLRNEYSYPAHQGTIAIIYRLLSFPE